MGFFYCSLIGNLTGNSRQRIGIGRNADGGVPHDKGLDVVVGIFVLGLIEGVFADARDALLDDDGRDLMDIRTAEPHGQLGCREIGHFSRAVDDEGARNRSFGRRTRDVILHLIVAARHRAVGVAIFDGLQLTGFAVVADVVRIRGKGMHSVRLFDVLLVLVAAGTLIEGIALTTAGRSNGGGGIGVVEHRDALGFGQNKLTDRAKKPVSCALCGAGCCLCGDCLRGMLKHRKFVLRCNDRRADCTGFTQGLARGSTRGLDRF